MKKFALDFSQALTENVKIADLRNQIASVRDSLASLTSCRTWERENETRLLVDVSNALIRMNARVNAEDSQRKTEMLNRVQRTLDQVYA